MLQSIKNLYHLGQSIVADLYYRSPGKKIKIIGVTGTDGKTTTTHLIYHILKTSGKKVSMISSVYAAIGGKTYDTGFHVTTPDVFPLHRFLQKSVVAGDEYFVLETTSHALSQNRVFGIPYFISVLTNVTHEHLDFHKDYKAYLTSKLVLLENSNSCIINADDRSYDLLKGLITKPFKTYALHQKADYTANLAKELKLNLTEYNNYNSLAAYAVCSELGIPDKSIRKALHSFTLPQGRLEIITKKPIISIIDFAHTPNAFRSVLGEIKKLYVLKGNRLIHVFGSAGLRDSAKRPMMGKESSQYADHIIVTEEDYRTENPQEIAAQIISGIDKKNLPVDIVLDRTKAIEKAVEIAHRGDVIVLTGKAHEKSLCRGKTEYPWNEKDVLLQALKKYKTS